VQIKSEILIVDDHPIFRRGLSQLINEEHDMDVCGEAEDVDEAKKAIGKLQPDMVIVDISLKDRSGMELLRYMTEKYPQLPSLVLSMHDETLYAERVLRAGARGYIMKQEMTGNVIQAIRQVLKGKIYASDSIVESMLGKLTDNRVRDISENAVDKLSNRELEVFQMIGKGFGRKEIAEMLNLSVKTIGTYRENIKKKLTLKNSSELMKHAFEWVRLQNNNSTE
jgi:DNA-binding NarL/FixJ family response regulator